MASQDKDTFWYWLSHIFDKGTKKPISFIWITSLFSVSGIGLSIYQIVTGISQQPDDKLAYISLGLNAVFLIIALLSLKPIYVDYVKTNKKFSEEQIKDFGFTNSKEFDEMSVRANILLSQFNRQIIGFVSITILLYLTMAAKIYVKQTYPNNNDKTSIQKGKNILAVQTKSMLDSTVLWLQNTPVSDTFYNPIINKRLDKIVENVAKAQTAMFKSSIRDDIFEILETLLNNLGIIFLFAAFLVLYKNTLTPTYVNSLKFEIPVVLLTLVTALHVGTLFLLPDITNHLNVNRVFKILSGIGNAVFMALLFGRFDSRYFKSIQGTLIALYSYAAIQTLFCMFDYIVAERRFLIMELTVLGCLVGKCIMLLYIIWMYYSKRLYYYFLFYPKSKNHIDENWNVLGDKFEVQDIS